jgi:hypothetical protein
LRCYECDGRGHFARECPTRKHRKNSTNTNAKQGGRPNPCFQNTRRRAGDGGSDKHSENYRQVETVTAPSIPHLFLTLSSIRKSQLEH